MRDKEFQYMPSSYSMRSLKSLCEYAQDGLFIQGDASGVAVGRFEFSKMGLANIRLVVGMIACEVDLEALVID
jgi:hypothetical protein